MLFASVLTLVFLSSSAYATDTASLEGLSVTEIGAIPKNSKVVLEPVDPSKTYFQSANSGANGSEGFQTISPAAFYSVKSFSNSAPSTPDNATLQSLASMKSLLIQQADLTQNSRNCVPSIAGLTCTLQNEVPAYKSGFFDFVAYLANRMNPTSWLPPDRTTEVDSKPASDGQVVQALEKAVTQVNSKVSATQKSLSLNCETPPLPPPCGVQQALQAYHAHKNEITKDIIVFNDFSDGKIMGKMWLLNSDGTPAKILQQNPIPVSRGPSGFGSGDGSLKTPNGALLTKSYRPPREGNVKDGIELVGLDPDNKDVHSRGILLHGWNPYTSTEGCLGVAGTLETGVHGKRTEGLPPYYLDELKKTVFKEGGVLIYDFTPQRKNLCK
ncbi:MAG TPA: hypothetical protein VIG33_17670 [Pseudobdellovibrionaceae bacterium]|jgi:hypothetical protein